MTLQTRLTAAEFDTWVLLPENAAHNFEFIGGEIRQVVSNNRSARISANILIALGVYLYEHPIGDLTNAEGGYLIGDERYIPDIGFCYTHKRSDLAYNPNPPDLAVEVVSPTDSQHDITIKVGNYLGANVVVWVVYPEEKRVEVYTPGQGVKVLGENDILDGGSVLPNFSLSIKNIFTPLGK